MPGIIAGHNDRIAWGVTNLGFDVQDLYIEKMDLRTGQYVFAGQVEQARPRAGTDPRQGPAAGRTLHLGHAARPGLSAAENGRVMTLQWTAAEPAHFPQCVSGYRSRAQLGGVQDARSRASAGPGQNFVYADVDGNIGYQAAGKLPIRRNYQGDVPVDGSSGENEWDGYIPFEAAAAVV